MSKNYYVSGGFNVICDICGKKIKAGEAKHRWMVSYDKNYIK